MASSSIWIIVIIFILIFLSFFIFSGVIISSSIDPTPGPTPEPVDDTEGSFNISNTKIFQLSNISSLQLSINTYVKKVNSVALQFLQIGIYNIEINFNITKQNKSGQSFSAYLFISNSSSKDVPVTYDGVSGKVNGPQFIQYNEVGYCGGPNNGKDVGNLALPDFHRFPQKGQENSGGTLSPLVVFRYPCKSANDNEAYSNYYSMTCIINITDITKFYYLQTAFDANNADYKVFSGNIMKGNGKIFINYLN